jgi:hypothetical protein
MMNAAYMALVVMAWALAIAMVGGVALFLVEVALEVYEEHFQRR